LKASSKKHTALFSAQAKSRSAKLMQMPIEDTRTPALKKSLKAAKKRPLAYSDKAAMLLKMRHRPTILGLTKHRKVNAIYFSMEEVLKFLAQRDKAAKAPSAPSVITPKAIQLSVPDKPMPMPPPRASFHPTASLADILGFNPTAKEKPKPKWKEYDESRVLRKYLPYFKQLVALRDHVQAGLDFHAQDTLKRSSKDETGDLSSYGQHLADAGTDTFSRDFTLGLVSSEQDLLFEIDEAFQRIFNGTYGICEITGEQIGKERLMAVPFTRYSIEGQQKYEKEEPQLRQAQKVTSISMEEMDSNSRNYDDDEDEG
jgi:RNA polymerase-binding transcription factor DksA